MRPPAALEAVLSPQRGRASAASCAVAGWWVADPALFPLFLIRAFSWEVGMVGVADAARALAARHPVGAMLVVVQHAQGVGMVLVAPQAHKEEEIRLVTWVRATLPVDQARAWVSLLESGSRESQSSLLAGAQLVCERTEVAGRFFREVGPWMRRLSVGWLGVPDDAVEVRRRLSLTFLTRVIFLFMVQERGWLAGDRLYLERLSRPTDEVGSLYRDRLRPLFFSVLNTPDAERPPAARSLPDSGEIPYLNGGLFSETDEEEAFAQVALPCTLVREIFHALHVRYRFRLQETSALRCDALDPRLLGTVFERWMGADERSRDGAFYTPPELVDDVVEDAFSGLLARRGLERAWSALLEGRADANDRERLRQEITSWRVLDPACGSGAFLLGAWAWLMGARRRLAEGAGRVSEAAQSAWSREIVTRQLFGVDRSHVAVQLAELRLWLAVASTEPSGRAPAMPLPGLRHRVRWGDALLSPSSLWVGSSSMLSSHERRRLRTATQAWLASHGRERERAVRRWAGVERRVMASAWRRRLRSVVVSDGGTQTGLGLAMPLVEERKGASAADELRAAVTAVSRGGAGPFFDAEVHFSEVLADGGFDAVIGNPPWLPLHRLPRWSREALRRRFSWLRALRGRDRSRQGDSDVSVAFAEQAWRWLKPSGVLALLLPSKVFRAPYGQRLRRSMVAEGCVLRLRDLAREERRQRDFAAACYPGLLIAARMPGGPSSHARVHVGPPEGRRAMTLEAVFQKPGDPSSAWSWPSSVSVDGASASSVLVPWHGPVLGGSHTVRLGVKTGANSIFLQSTPPCAGPWLPALRGRDVHLGSRQWLLFGHDLRTGAVLPSLPAETRVWLEPFHVKLLARADRRRGDPPWKLFRVRPELLGYRVVWADIARRLCPRVLPPLSRGGPVPLNTLYYLPAPDRRRALRWAAWLRSAPMQARVEACAPQALHGHRRHFGYVVESLPWPDALHPTEPVCADVAALDRIAEVTETLASGTEPPELSDTVRRILSRYAVHAPHQEALPDVTEPVSRGLL